ncbi:hypothetical protein C8Q79DRAFT_923984 [Trametes meyenii]|nr:hypothetical protein C8Q79DRAFT_923984 [Trametes meyenii]
MAPILDSLSFVGLLSVTGTRALPSTSATQTTSKLEPSSLALLAGNFLGIPPSLADHKDTQSKQATSECPDATTVVGVSSKVIPTVPFATQPAPVTENSQVELLVARVAIHQKDAKIKELTGELVNLKMALAGREIELKEARSGRSDREETLQRLHTAASRFFDRKLQTTEQTGANDSRPPGQAHSHIFADYVTKMARRYADAIEINNKAYESAAKLLQKGQEYASRLRQKDAEIQILVHGLKVKLERSREQARLAIHLAGKYREEVTKRDHQLSQLRQLTTPHVGGGSSSNDCDYNLDFWW